MDAGPDLPCGAATDATLAPFSDEPEAHYRQTVPRAARRGLGQFFTPYAIARFMANWVFAGGRRRSVLDPAVGLGVFFRAARAAVPDGDLHCVGYDLDPQVLAAARGFAPVLQPGQLDLRQADYLRAGWDDRYDAILANPPYLKCQDYADRAACNLTHVFAGAARLCFQYGGGSRGAAVSLAS